MWSISEKRQFLIIREANQGKLELQWYWDFVSFVMAIILSSDRLTLTHLVVI